MARESEVVCGRAGVMKRRREALEEWEALRRVCQQVEFEARPYAWQGWWWAGEEEQWEWWQWWNGAWWAWLGRGRGWERRVWDGWRWVAMVDDEEEEENDESV